MQIPKPFPANFPDLEEDSTSIPSSFMLESKIIFISNSEEKPSSVGEDVLAIGLDLGKDDTIESLNQKINDLLEEYPEITLEDKLELIERVSQNKKVDISTFLNMMIIKKAGLLSENMWMEKQ